MSTHFSISARFSEIHDWEPIPVATIEQNNENGIYDHESLNRRNLIDNLDSFPLLDADGTEIPIYNTNRQRILRRKPIVYEDEPTCGVLMDLENIHILFNTSGQNFSDNHSEISDYADPVKVEAYPLGFLRVAGNVLATGIPQCFHPILAEISRSVRKNPNGSTDSDDDSLSEEDLDSPGPYTPRIQVIKPVSSQFYNYISHRTASRAGDFDAQQGSVTSAIAGAFAQTQKDEKTADTQQKYCDTALPSERFHKKIHLSDCPTCCRAELVYSVDIRSLKSRSQSGAWVTPPLYPF